MVDGKLSRYLLPVPPQVTGMIKMDEEKHLIELLLDRVKMEQETVSVSQAGHDSLTLVSPGAMKLRCVPHQ